MYLGRSESRFAPTGKRDRRAYVHRQRRQRSDDLSSLFAPACWADPIRSREDLSRLSPWVPLPALRRFRRRCGGVSRSLPTLKERGTEMSAPLGLDRIGRHQGVGSAATELPFEGRMPTF